MRKKIDWRGAVLALILAGPAAEAAPVLADPALGTLELVVHDTTLLPRVDGLAMDAYGNLFAALETANHRGGVVSIDKATGAVTPISIGVITGADQVVFEAGSGTLYATNEFTPGEMANRLFRITVVYDAAHRPTGGRAASITTTAGINDPEGLVSLPAGSPFGPAGRLYVAEDLANGAIHAVDVGGGTGTVTTLVTAAAGLNRPEGLAYGDFAGQLAPALYAAETLDSNILRIDVLGQVSVFGNPAGIGLLNPDNLEFGPDGYLYVTEDPVNGAPGRLVRIAADGTHGVVATGFDKPQGLVFDSNGDLYISEQNTASLWRLRFNATATVPEPGSLVLLASGWVWMIRMKRRGTAVSAE